MAVVQISRIQIRRGQKNQGIGLPQLASGEMAWAIDTQELYIGNGSVSEGSPAVGNTKIITQRDNLLEIANSYRYKSKNPLVKTDPDPTKSISRNLEDRLNDHVSNLAYGILSNGQDMTVQLQNAIDNLYIDNRAESERVTLEFLPGKYIISSTIYIPSYVSIVGAGRQRTTFEYRGTTGPVFRFIDDRATRTDRAVTIDSFNNQPKNIYLKGFTIKVNEQDTSCFRLESVRDSNFEDIEIIGNYDWATGQDSSQPLVDTNYAIGLESYSSLVTCKNNFFRKIKIYRYIYTVVSKHDILNNTWDDCEFQESKYGITFGQGTNTTLTGQNFGPRRNIIKNSYFDDIKESGILITNGYGNQSNNNLFINVGNDGAGNNITADGSSIISFISAGNLSWGDVFDRSFDTEYDGQTIYKSLGGLNPDGTNNFGKKYYPEVSGNTYFQNQASQHLRIPTNYNSILFRIPYLGNCTIFINYLLTVYPINQTRAGRMTITVDDQEDEILMYEEYDYMGNPVYEYNVSFTAQLGDGVVNVFCKHTNAAYQAEFSYTYSIMSKIPG